HLPLECAGEVLALMDLMERRQCTMQHLHDISQVSYATIHELLTLKTSFHTPRPRAPSRAAGKQHDGV
ncbi:MAG: hypothetical protein JNG86_04920, partial [Verrucomicrobiaceae bacterium]|nr:hypothetical protein [Verrucomicrobiaceae bacterium]